MRPDQDEFFTALYHDHFNQVKIYALGFVSDPNLAEEIAQDTFHTAMEKIEDVMKAEMPIKWLKTTAKNKAYNEQRTRQRHLKRYLSLDDPDTPEPSSAACVEDSVIARDEEAQRPSVGETVQQALTPAEITLLKQVALERRPYLEVSEELGISLWTCQKRMQRIRGKLAEKFPEYKKKKNFEK